MINFVFMRITLLCILYSNVRKNNIIKHYAFLLLHSYAIQYSYGIEHFLNNHTIIFSFNVKYLFDIFDCDTLFFFNLQ